MSSGQPQRDDDKTFTQIILATSAALTFVAAPMAAVADYPEQSLSFVVLYPYHSTTQSVQIFLLSFVGVYSLRNSIAGCAMAADFEVFGLILKRLNLPIVPTILGMV